MRRDEVIGSQEINLASDEEPQNPTAKEDDNFTNGDEESVGSQDNGSPLKLKKRKEGGDFAFTKKKAKIAI